MAAIKCRIAVVDLQTLGAHHTEEPSLETYTAVGEQVVKAFTDIGFVYITNHGVEDRVVTEVNETSAVFFQQSPEVKTRQCRGVKEMQGYTGPNMEMLVSDDNRQELRESYDVTDLTGLFPDDVVPQFRPAVRNLVEPLITLTYRLLRALECGLGLPEDTLLSCHSNLFRNGGLSRKIYNKENSVDCSDEKNPLKRSDITSAECGNTSAGSENTPARSTKTIAESDIASYGSGNATCLRVLHYPPVPEATPKAGLMRCGAHTDYGTFTLLLQDGMGGLEEHRVLVPVSEQLQRRVRRSVAFFVIADDHVVMYPLDTTVVSSTAGGGERPQGGSHEGRDRPEGGSRPGGGERQEGGRPVTALEYLNMRFAETYK